MLDLEAGIKINENLHSKFSKENKKIQISISFEEEAQNEYVENDKLIKLKGF